LASSIAARVRCRIFLELAFEALEQREGIGGAPAKTARHLSLASRRTLRALPFMTGVAEGDLPSPPKASARRGARPG